MPVSHLKKTPPIKKKKKANRYTVFSFVQQSKAQDEKKNQWILLL